MQFKWSKLLTTGVQQIIDIRTYARTYAPSSKDYVLDSCYSTTTTLLGTYLPDYYYYLVVSPIFSDARRLLSFFFSHNSFPLSLSIQYLTILPRFKPPSRNKIYLFKGIVHIFFYYHHHCSSEGIGASFAIAFRCPSSRHFPYP